MPEVVYRLKTVLDNDGKAFNLTSDWAYFESDELPFKLKYGPSWTVFDHGQSVSFLRADKEFSQFSPFRMYPNSATISVTVDKNELGKVKDQYLENLKAAFEGWSFTEFVVGDIAAFSMSSPDFKKIDWYLFLDNDEVLVVYTEVGNGILKYQMTQEILSMLASLEYVELPEEPLPDYSALKEEVFKNILVEGVGMTMLDKLPEKLLIETDAIGAGAGPIDYYFSGSLNLTFKYERDSDTILDKREGETSAF